MAPNQLGNSLFLSETNSADPVQIISKPGVQQEVPQIKTYVKSTKPQHRWQIVWRNVVIFIYLHVAAIYGLYLLFAVMQLKTFVWGWLNFYFYFNTI
jgi:ribosomal protein S28E/S33